MVLLLSGLGIAVGMATAFAIHNLFARLRQRALMPVIVIGWVLAAIVLFLGASFAYAYFVVNSDPFASMGPAGGVLALMYFLLLAVCGLVGLLHSRKFQLPWPKAFGLLMAESGAAFLAAVGLYTLYFPVAHILQGGNREAQEIFTSYSQTSQILSLATNTLVGALLALEGIRPLVQKRDTLPTTAAPNTE
jgi:hypothetical protein